MGRHRLQMMHERLQMVLAGHRMHGAERAKRALDGSETQVEEHEENQKKEIEEV